MIETFNTLRGQFCIQCIKNDKVIDEYIDHNFIMKPARRSMAELFTGTNTRRMTKLVLGTAGNFGADIYSPITENNGFSKERTSLFSETIKNKALNDSVFLYPGELVQITNGELYKYKDTTAKTVTLSNANLSTLFDVYNKYPVKTYTVNVRNYSNTVVFNGTENFASEPSKNSVTIEFGTDTTVTYTIVVGNSEGNDQITPDNHSFFNEAGIYINDRLFCMKSFPAKLKDDSTTLKIIWKIIF